MSAVATPTAPHAPRSRPPASEDRTARLFEPESGGASLEELILGAWEDLAATGAAGCPACGGRMAAGRGCGDCGTTLS